MIEKLQVGDWVVDKAYPEWGVATVTNLFGKGETQLVVVQYWSEKDKARYWPIQSLSKV